MPGQIKISTDINIESFGEILKFIKEKGEIWDIQVAAGPIITHFNSNNLSIKESLDRFSFNKNNNDCQILVPKKSTFSSVKILEMISELFYVTVDNSFAMEFEILHQHIDEFRKNIETWKKES